MRPVYAESTHRLAEEPQTVKEISRELARWEWVEMEQREKQERLDSQAGETHALGSGNRAAVS